MSGMKDVRSAVSDENGTYDSEPESRFLRRTLSNRSWWKMPRRYVLAVMCYLAFFITGWMLMNVFFTLGHLLTLEESEHTALFPAMTNLTFEDLDKMDSSFNWGNIFAQIPGAILVIKYTGHKVLGISVIATSILHMLTPLTMRHHIFGTTAVICLQGVATGPMMVSCLSLWRDWAPPSERTRLVTLALGGIFISPHLSILLCYELVEHVSPVAGFIVPGMCGLTWSLVWYTLTSDSPTNDPLISEAELLFLEEKIPTENKLKIELKKIPAKSILTSPPVISLCFVFLCEGYILQTLIYGSFMFYVAQVEEELRPCGTFTCANTFYIIFNALIPLTGYLSDLLIIKLTGRVTIVRKCFFCAAAAIHAVFIFAVFTPDLTASFACFLVSVFAHTLSIPGYISNALDLSSPYVTVLVGIGVMCMKVASIVFDSIMDYFINGKQTWKVPLAGAGILSASAAILFAIFGSGEEQPWSIRNISTQPRNRNDSLCYPRGDEADENSLVTDAL